MLKNNAFEILMVEDNPRDIDLALRAMKKRNLVNRMHVVTDGQEALEYIFCEGRYADRDHHQRPKLVLLDLKLPKVDGLEVLRRMKSDERTKVIPVVVLTSSSEDRDIVESYKLGVNSYIQKPVEFDKFLDCVEELGLYWLLMNKPPPEGCGD